MTSTTCSSLHNLVGDGAPPMAATFHLCTMTMLDTHILILGLFFAPLVTASFSH